MNNPKLKAGDTVVMHTCIESENPNNAGKIWTCKTDSFKTGECFPNGSHESVFLEGYRGSFSTAFLQKVNLLPDPDYITVHKDNISASVVYAVDGLLVYDDIRKTCTRPINETEKYELAKETLTRLEKLTNDDKNYKETF